MEEGVTSRNSNILPRAGGGQQPAALSVPFGSKEVAENLSGTSEAPDGPALKSSAPHLADTPTAESSALREGVLTFAAQLAHRPPESPPSRA